MRDAMEYGGERRGERLVAVVRGVDHRGRPFEFEVPPATLQHNLRVQTEYVGHLVAADRMFQHLVKLGVHPDTAWRFVEMVVPAPFEMSVDDGSDPVGNLIADRSQQLFERGDDLFGQPDD
jgi:hypothetical protein